MESKEIEEPIIESEVIENEEIESNLDLTDIKTNPYHFIKNHYESIYPCMGDRIFSVLSFLPISLILPKIVRKNTNIRMHINLLLLAPSGSAKSMISSKFAEITYNPLITKQMTVPRLYSELKKRQKVSLIVEDVSVWFMDEIKIKFLEGVVGEEETMSHETMRNIKDGNDKKVEVVSFCSGTPENITNQKIKTGILRRCFPMIITMLNEENNKIIEFIASNMGKEEENTKSDIIKNYYKELYKIQEGKNKEIAKISGYIFPDEISKQVEEFMKKLTFSLNKKYGIIFATETEEFFRLMACHGFLNIFSKKENNLIKDNKLIIDDKDFNVAKKLMIENINTKVIILHCIDLHNLDGVTTRSQLLNYEKRRRDLGMKEMPKEAKFILENNLRK